MIYFVEGKPDENVIGMVKDGKIVLINSRNIISRKEIESAYLKAKRSYSYGTNIGRDLGSEMMLYLYGGRQISEAMKQYGIDETWNQYFLISEDELNPEQLGFKILEFNECSKKEGVLRRLEKIALAELKK